MNTKDIKPTTLDGIKRLAYRLKKEHTIPHHEALDRAAHQAGFKHFQDARRQLVLGLAPKPERVVDGYVPDYKHKCRNCDQSPVVTAYKAGKLIYQGEMCGPCTWGEARTIDPSTWNE